MEAERIWVAILLLVEIPRTCDDDTLREIKDEARLSVETMPSFVVKKLGVIHHEHAKPLCEGKNVYSLALSIEAPLSFNEISDTSLFEEIALSIGQLPHVSVRNAGGIFVIKKFDEDKT